SLEYFPPKTESGVKNLKDRMIRMKGINPLFTDFTWGAGGSTSDLTLDLTIYCKEEAGMEPNMHLTCTNMPVEKIDAALQGCKDHGICNIVALRGDPPHGQDTWTAQEGGFTCALDLVRYIRQKHGDYFGISVAGYPEGHPDNIKVVEGGLASLSPAEKARCGITQEDGKEVVRVCSDADWKVEMEYLKQKVDAGADVIITQMFFDPEVFRTFGQACKDYGINVPIVPGLMCLNTYMGFKRMTHFCKTRVPLSLAAKIDEVKDDEAGMKALGTEYGAHMVAELISMGAVCLHFYTLNLEKVTIGILKRCGLQGAYEPPESENAAEMIGMIKSSKSDANAGHPSSVIQSLISTHKLAKHPVGGWFRETWRTSDVTATSRGSRNCATSIVTLLAGPVGHACSMAPLHKVKSDEVYFFHAAPRGAGALVHVLHQNKQTSVIRLDVNNPQVIVKAGDWFGAQLTGDTTDPDLYCLMGCVVAPGFDPQDFAVCTPEDVAGYPSGEWESIMPDPAREISYNKKAKLDH
ncbi:unnamed protein product, partial [Chrysoparadoxa australica]